MTNTKPKAKPNEDVAAADQDYCLDDQVGFILRQVAQRHTTIFADMMIEGLTPTQFAVLAKLYEVGPCSQNHLGRLTAMDAATVKGVVDRLSKRDFVVQQADPTDGRRLMVALSDLGTDVIVQALPRAKEITEATLKPLNLADRKRLLKLLKQMR